MSRLGGLGAWDSGGCFPTSSFFRRDAILAELDGGSRHQELPPTCCGRVLRKESVWSPPVLPLLPGRGTRRPLVLWTMETS
jgi:hypothetical protein